MSEHDRITRDYVSENDDNPRWVSCHRGNRGDFIERHCRQARMAKNAGISAVRKLAPELFHRATDERTLRLAFDYLKANGGRAPGIDGQRFEDIGDQFIWQMCRDQRDEIRAGQYVRRADRIVRIPKGTGRGFREIAISCIEDRIVERAIVEIVQPLLNPLFDPHSFGFRPRKGRLRALALAERYFLADRRYVWVTQDIRDAFVNVPVARVLQILRKYLPADDLIAHVANVVKRPNRKGLRQGGSLSPLLLNLYLHHLLDRPWQLAMPETPMLRFGDDILIVCQTRQEAVDAHRALGKLLTPAGMPLKFPAEEAVHDLTSSDVPEWLGYRLRLEEDKLAVEIADRSWERLAEHLARSSNHAKRCETILRGWIGELGPCYSQFEASGVYQRISTIARHVGVSEIMTEDRFATHWQRAFARWCKSRKRADVVLDGIRCDC